MKLDYFNIGKQMAVLSFNLGMLQERASQRRYVGFMGNQSLCVIYFFFSKQCNFVGVALRHFLWLISFWILEKFLFIKPNYGYILYYWCKVYYPTSAMFFREKKTGRRNTILWCRSFPNDKHLLCGMKALSCGMTSVCILS